MKFIKVLLITAMLGTISQSMAIAQAIKLPQASSKQTIVQDLGLSTVSVIYSKPNIKGRLIFGGIVPYGLVWRTGASAATTIVFNHEVQIAGRNLAKGSYALFTIPGKDKWIIILNTKPDQWGADTYDAKYDAIRFEVIPASLPVSQETFNISFPEVTPASVKLAITWDKTSVSFPIAINEDRDIQATIDSALLSPKKPYFEAALYYYNSGKDLKKALEWIELADKATPEPLYYIKYWKGLVQNKLGDKEAARKSAYEALPLAQKLNQKDYIRMINTLINQTKP